MNLFIQTRLARLMDGECALYGKEFHFDVYYDRCDVEVRIMPRGELYMTQLAFYNCFNDMYRDSPQLYSDAHGNDYADLPINKLRDILKAHALEAKREEDFNDFWEDFSNVLARTLKEYLREDFTDTLDLHIIRLQDKKRKLQDMLDHDMNVDLYPNDFKKARVEPEEE